MSLEPDASTFDLLTEASQRWVRTIDGLTDEQFDQNSLLPGWSRAHVTAHLALNAQALAGVLDGVAAGRRVPMYGSPAQRNRDIEDLARAGAPELRARTLESVSEFAEAAEAFPQGRADELVERVPGGHTFPAGASLSMRWREVEIHHADLGSGYSARDWPAAFAVAVLTFLTSDDGPPREWPRPFTIVAQDVVITWDVGSDSVRRPAPTVTGDAADLAWWLAGRGLGEGLHTDEGELPEVPAW